MTGVGSSCGVGLSSTVTKGNVKYVPAPMGMMPFGVEEVSGSVAASTDFYIKAPILDYTSIKSMALYSPDIECAPSYYASIFSGNKVGIDCGRQNFAVASVNLPTDQDAPYGVSSILYSRITGSHSTTTPLGGDRSVYAHFVDSGAVGVSPRGFAGATERNIYCYWGQPVSSSLTIANITDAITASPEAYVSGSPVSTALPYRPGNAIAYGRYLGLKLSTNNIGDEFTNSFSPAWFDAYILFGYLNR